MLRAALPALEDEASDKFSKDPLCCAGDAFPERRGAFRVCCWPDSRQAPLYAPGKEQAPFSIPGNGP